MSEFNRDERKMLNLRMVAYILAESSCFRVRNISRLIGVSERTCYRYVAELVRSNVVMRVSRGKYISDRQYFN